MFFPVSTEEVSTPGNFVELKMQVIFTSRQLFFGSIELFDECSVV